MAPSRSVNALIEEAMRRGDFDDLPGEGKPIDLSAYFDTPEDFRLAYSILKNASVLPHEAELLKEIAVLREQLDATADESRKKAISKAIQERLLNYNLMVERTKKERKR